MVKIFNIISHASDDYAQWVYIMTSECTLYDKFLRQAKTDGRGKGRTGGAFREIKIYDYTQTKTGCIYLFNQAVL